jgi:uroporphyrinogen decarboxylase
MTARERFNRQMHYQSIDRCFNMEFGYWQENFEQWEIFVKNGIRNNNEADVFFAFDKIGRVSGNLWLSPAFERKVVRETESSLILINKDGLLAEVPRDESSTIPHFLESSVTTPEDWKKVKAERLEVEDSSRIVNIEKLKEHHPVNREYPLAFHAGSLIGKVRDLLTLEGLAYAWEDYPGMVEDMVETCCRMIENAADQILPHFDCDLAAGWEDICCNVGPLVSMDLFKEVLMPRYKRIGKKLKQYGIDIWYTDCDGDMRHLIPYFLEAGLNTMFPWEVNGSGHPSEMLEKYGPELRIMGGVDKMQLGKGPEAIKSYVEGLVPWVEKGGYIPFCDHRCPPNVKQEDYLYYLNLKQELFGL